MKIEEMDIADLRLAIQTTNNQDTKRVFEQLERGSRNHLRAFAKQLNQAGGTYTAANLSQEDFAQIATSGQERGGGQGQAGGRGKGQGQGNGQGNAQGNNRGNGQGQGRGRGKKGRSVGQRAEVFIETQRKTDVTLTLDKIQSIALLKLTGAPNHVILGMILQQALLLGLFGYGIAYFLGQRLFPMFPRRVIITHEDLIQLAMPAN